MKKSLLNAEIFVSLKGYRKIVNIKNIVNKKSPALREGNDCGGCYFRSYLLKTRLTRKTASIFNASLFKVSSLHELFINLVHLFRHLH